MYYFLINVHIYILLSKASVIEGRPVGVVLARICFSDIHAKWCHFLMDTSAWILCINERIDLPFLKPMDI